MDLLKDNRIERQEKVQQTINESHVNADSQNDRLRKQKSQRARHVLLQQFSKVDFDLFLFSVDAPILRSSSQFSCFVDQDDWRVGFF